MKLLSGRSVWNSIKRGTMVDNLGEGMLLFTGATLFIMMVVMAVYVISRKLGHPVPGSFHFSEQAMIIVFAFPLAAIAVKKGHIQFELFIRRVSLKTQERLEILYYIVGIVIWGAIAWWAWKAGLYSLATGEYSMGEVDFPIYPFRIALALGMSVFAIQLVILLIRGVAREVMRSKGEVVRREEAPPSVEITRGETL